MAYTPEFRMEAVRLFRIGGRGIKATAYQIGIAPGTLRKWIAQADIGDGLRLRGASTHQRHVPGHAEVLQAQLVRD